MYRYAERQTLVSGSHLTVTEVEPAEFDIFYDSWRDPIRRALALTIGDTTLADEAIDEAMTRALSRWQKIGSYERPEGWVYRVGLNFARGVYRKRRWEVLQEIDAASVVWTRSEPSFIEVLDAVGRLSLKLRSVVVARFYLDWTMAEIAESLDVPEGTVKSRLSRALERLAEELKEKP